MGYEILMPQLSDSMEEGKLVSWKVHPGDRVKAGDIIAEVESDKAVIDVQSFKEGVVRELKVSEGQSVPVGSVIAILDIEGESEEPAPKREKIEEPKKGAEISGTVSEKSGGDKEENETFLERIFGSKAVEGSASSEEPKRATHLAAGEASPKARALAAAYGIDIESLQKEGKIPVPAHEEDIRQWYLKRYFTPKALKLMKLYSLDPSLFGKSKKVDERCVEEYVKEHEIPLPKPLTSMKKAIVTTVSNAAKRPVYHIFDHIDAELLRRSETKRLTYTVWLLKLFAEAMMEHEGFRTTLKDDKLFVWPNASISLAVADGEDLYTPVFEDLNRKSVDEISRMLERMREKIASKRVRPEDFEGSTFGVSNLGMTGIERFDAMINRNDSAIAAVGAEIEGKIAVTLTVDHRIVNGYQAALFMKTIKSLAVDEIFFKRAKESGY